MRIVKFLSAWICFCLAKVFDFFGRRLPTSFQEAVINCRRISSRLYIWSTWIQGNSTYGPWVYKLD